MAGLMWLAAYNPCGKLHIGNFKRGNPHGDLEARGGVRWPLRGE